MFAYQSLDFIHLLPKDVQIDKQLQSGLRVTVKLNKTQKQGNLPLFFFRCFHLSSLREVLIALQILHISSANVSVCACSSESKLCKGAVVAPHLPRTEGGIYWGYSVRLASCLSKSPALPMLSNMLHCASQHLASF